MGILSKTGRPELPVCHLAPRRRLTRLPPRQGNAAKASTFQTSDSTVGSDVLILLMRMNLASVPCRRDDGKKDIHGCHGTRFHHPRPHLAICKIAKFLSRKANAGCARTQGIGRLTEQ